MRLKADVAAIAFDTRVLGRCVGVIGQIGVDDHGSVERHFDFGPFASIAIEFHSPGFLVCPRLAATTP